MVDRTFRAGRARLSHSSARESTGLHAGRIDARRADASWGHGDCADAILQLRAARGAWVDPSPKSDLCRIRRAGWASQANGPGLMTVDAWCRGANRVVACQRESSFASPNSLKTQRPSLKSAGRAGLRIESSTTELRWRPPNLAARCSRWYSMPAERPSVTSQQQLP